MINELYMISVYTVINSCYKTRNTQIDNASRFKFYNYIFRDAGKGYYCMKSSQILTCYRQLIKHFWT